MKNQAAVWEWRLILFTPDNDHASEVHSEIKAPLTLVCSRFGFPASHRSNQSDG